MSTQTVEVADSDLVRQDTAQTLRFFAIIRLVAVIAVAVTLIAFLILHTLPFSARPVLLYVLPGYFAVSLWMFLLARRGTTSDWPLIAQLIVDTIILTVGIELTGGLESPFLPFYFVILTSASLVSLRGLLLVGASLVVTLGIAIAQAPSGVDILQVSAFGLILGLIGLQAFLLVRLINRRDRALAKQKEEFLFRTVHDIRSPSTVIRYSSEILRDSSLPPEAVEQLEQIERANLRINGMVSELMAIARGESGATKLTLEPVPVLATTRKLAVALATNAQEKQVTIAVNDGEDISVLADQLRLEEALTNLMDNAIKYNRQGGTVEVSVARDGKDAVIAVRDTGIGIRPENQASMFKPFFREVQDSSVPGTGLGLYGAKKLIEIMGGSIRYETKLDEGTTFFVALPAA